MLSDRDALLAAIRANPDEDTPRLMFADWLDEHGDSADPAGRAGSSPGAGSASTARAEFIRVQCEFARLCDDASDSHALYEFLRDRDWVTRPAADWTKIDAGIHHRIALAQRDINLLKRRATGWKPKLPRGVGRWDGFHRGFVHRFVLDDADKAIAGADVLLRSAPAVTLIANGFPAAVAERLGDAGLLGWVAGLELSGEEIGSGLRVFGHRPEAAGVRSLVVGNDRDAAAAALVDSPYWTGLRSLTLAGRDPTTTADALLTVPHLRSLRRLVLAGCDWMSTAVRALAAGGFRELVSLSILHCGLNDDGAEMLAACPDLAGLRTLDLAHNNLTGRGATALLCSPYLKNVAFLGLEGNPCTGVDAKRLSAAEPGGLRMLHCHGTRFATADVRALARSPRLRALWYLDLDDNNLTTAAVRQLVSGLKGFCPPIVWMTHNRIDDRGAELLAKWKAATALRVLHVRYNDTTDAGAQALLDSPNLTNLDDLGVSGVTEETAERLRKRFKRHADY